MTQELTSSERRWAFGLAFALFLLSWTSIKICLPALPRLADVFHSTAGGLKLSVSLYLIFFACSQPVWGGIVQRIGRRRTVLLGIFVSTIGSTIAMLAFDLPTYLIGRTLEGVGMGSASPVARAILTDVFDRREIARRMGTVSGAAAMMPALAPLVGGYLMVWISWRAIFGFFLILSVGCLFVAWRWLPETGTASADERPVTIRQLLGEYSSIFRSTGFWGFALAYATMTGGLLGYYSAMPYWFVAQLGIAEQHYAYLTIPTVGMYLVGLTSARFLIRNHQLETILLLGMLAALCTAVVTALLAILNISGVISIVASVSLFGLCAGLVVPSANGGAMTVFKKLAAPVSALLVATIFGSSALTASVAMNVNIDTLWPLAGYLGTLSIIGLAASYFWVWLPHRFDTN